MTDLVYNEGYEQLVDNDEIEDMLVSTYRNNARDLVLHRINLSRYRDMLTRLQSGPFFDRLTEMAMTTRNTLLEVEAILAAVEKQLPQDIQPALERLRVREEEAEGKARGQ